MKYFIVLRNKNPDENPDLAMDFKNLDRKSKVFPLLITKGDVRGVVGSKKHVMNIMSSYLRKLFFI
jgi:hypothetical protein